MCFALCSISVACQTAKRDIVIAIDASASVCTDDPTYSPYLGIGCKNWERLFKFVESLIEELVIGPNNTQAGVALFAEHVKMDVSLDR